LRRTPRLVLVVVTGVALSAVALAQDEMPATTTRIHSIVGSIIADVNTTSVLKDKALHDGAAIKASCIEDKLRRLQAVLETGRAVEQSWSTAQKSPAYGQRTLDRMNVLELSANSLAEEARVCTDAKTLQFELEVFVPPNLPDAPPGWPISTPPTFERERLQRRPWLPHRRRSRSTSRPRGRSRL
jgi:hypothetical protein